MAKIDLTNVTTLANGDVFDPQVTSDMIRAKIENKSVMTKYIKVDNTLEGVAGSTVTVPKWGYIGEAQEYEEGQTIDVDKMSYTTAQYTVKKIGKGARITDEAQLSGFGDPMGQATTQIAMSIKEKLDNDRVAVCYESRNICDCTSSKLNYDAIVDGVDMYGEEEDSAKVMLIHSKQKSTLRKDPNFISADKYDNNVMSTGAIGKIAGVEIVVSNKVAKFDSWYKVGGSTAVASSNIVEVQKTLPFAKIGDMVTKVTTPAYFNPIIKLDNDAETEDDETAITYFLKRGELVEHDRIPGVADDIICTAHGMAALTNEAKVVVLRTKA